MITGAGRGIGKRLAIGLARNGLRIGLLGRDQAELNSTRLEIEDSGGVAFPFRADVCNPDDVKTAVGLMTSKWGAVDALIANAAIHGPIGPFATSRLSAWRDVFDVNVHGVINCCHAVLPQMVKRRSGKILTISCTGVATPRPDFAVYSATKAAIARFVESLAEEVRDRNVQVNNMLPGGAYTTMTDEILNSTVDLDSAELEEAGKVRLTGGTPAEKQIQLALFLTSERSNHVTGKLIHVKDDWKRLEVESDRPDAFTVRRHLR